MPTPDFRASGLSSHSAQNKRPLSISFLHAQHLVELGEDSDDAGVLLDCFSVKLVPCAVFFISIK